MTLKFANIEISFSDLGGTNTDASRYVKFAEVASQFRKIGEGLTGGSHGTEHAYADYRVTDDFVIRQVKPSSITKGYLELIEWSMADEELKKISDASWTQCEERQKIEYEAILARQS